MSVSDSGLFPGRFVVDRAGVAVLCSVVRGVVVDGVVDVAVVVVLVVVVVAVVLRNC